MKFRHVPELDGLRGIAILAVMSFHLAHDVIPGGSLGVDLFFVLSGYLITSLLLVEQEAFGRIDYLAFLGRRARRLLPALAILLFAYAVLCPILFPWLAYRMWEDILTTAFYVTNLREAFAPFLTPLSHTWSLGIEEQFYIAWPFVVAALARRGHQWASRFLMLSWVALTVARLAYPNPHTTYYLTPLHATGLIAGSWLAFGGRVGLRAGLVPLLGILILMFTVGNIAPAYPAVQSLAELFCVLMLANPPAMLSLAPLRFMGRISYGTYLWHFPVAWAALYGAHTKSIIPVFAVSIALGAISTLVIEEPIRRYLGRLPAPELRPSTV